MFDPQQRWPERLMSAFAFVGVAVVAGAAGWLFGTLIKQWHWFGA